MPDAPGRVLIPGEPEAEAERRTAALGIVMDPVHATTLAGLADRLGVAVPYRLPGAG